MIWKVGLGGKEQKEMVLNHLKDRFKNCSGEKNFILIRSDIIQGLKNLYNHLRDEESRQLSMDLIDTVEDQKYRKK